MADLKTTDQLKLEKLFSMNGGYVLNFTNSAFEQFVRKNAGCNIFNSKYAIYGESKAKRLKTFWELESDIIVGKIIQELIEHWQTSKLINSEAVTDNERSLSSECRKIADRLQGKKVVSSGNSGEISEDEFLKMDFGQLSIDKLNLGGITEIIHQRIIEIQKNLQIKAPLSAIFLCGSTLEGILLGVASKNPEKFNRALSSPKNRETGKVLNLQEWSLNDMINVTHEIGFLTLDIKKFGHALRDFRNFIHPYEQWVSKFNPDEYTAQICWKVLQAAIYQLSKNEK